MISVASFLSVLFLLTRIRQNDHPKLKDPSPDGFLDDCPEESIATTNGRATVSQHRNILVSRSCFIKSIHHLERKTTTNGHERENEKRSDLVEKRCIVEHFSCVY